MREKTSLCVLILGEVLVCHGGGERGDDEQITLHTNLELPTLTLLGSRRIWKPVDTSKIREEDQFLLSPAGAPGISVAPHTRLVARLRG